LLTYLEEGQLSDGQMATLRGELGAGGSTAEVLRFSSSAPHPALPHNSPAKLAGHAAALPPDRCLVHCADHTHRHVGQAVTTSKVVVGMRA